MSKEDRMVWLRGFMMGLPSGVIFSAFFLAALMYHQGLLYFN